MQKHAELSQEMSAYRLRHIMKAISPTQRSKIALF